MKTFLQIWIISAMVFVLCGQNECLPTPGPDAARITFTPCGDEPNVVLPIGSEPQVVLCENVSVENECVDVFALNVKTILEDDTANLREGQFLLDGVRVGARQNLDSDATESGHTDCPEVYDPSGAGTNDNTCFVFQVGQMHICPNRSMRLELTAQTLNGLGLPLEEGRLLVSLNLGGDDGVPNAVGVVTGEEVSSPSTHGVEIRLSRDFISLQLNPLMFNGSPYAPSGGRARGDANRAFSLWDTKLVHISTLFVLLVIWTEMRVTFLLMSSRLSLAVEGILRTPHTDLGDANGLGTVSPQKLVLSLNQRSRHRGSAWECLEPAPVVRHEH